MYTHQQSNHREGNWCKAASLLGLTLGIVAGMALSVEAKTHDIQMTAVETEVVIDGGGENYAAWTFNGQFPGPVVRVTEGDTINFTLTNPATNKNPHAMDFHAAEIDFLKTIGLSIPVRASASPSWPRSRVCSSITAVRRP